MLAILAARDVSGLYRALRDEAGVSQRQIARRTGQSQSEVSEILAGRQVISHDVLVRIATGLGIPPERMGLSWWGPDGGWHGPKGTYPGGATVAETPEGVSAEMLRRHLIALGGAAMAGAPVARLGELLPELPGPPPVPLPAQLSSTQVAQVRDLTRRLDRATVTLGSSPEVSSAATTMAERLLSVPGPDQVRRALLIAVAELHVQAGWAGFDAGLYERAMHHYARALELGTEAGDAYLQALVLNYAGLATVEHGHPDDGLKMLQCARVKAWDIPRQSREVVIGEGSRVAVEACGLADSASALAALGQPEAAYRHLGMSRELWLPASGAAAGDLDRPAAWLEVQRGRLDVAQQLATASARRWQDVSRVGHTTSGILLATIHVKAGERDGPQLAHRAISAVAQLTSVRVRRQLAPLAEALVARPGSDAAALAEMAHQVAATRT